MPEAGIARLGSGLILLCAAVAAGLACSQTRSPAIRYEPVDRSIRPGDDFYGFANGVWMKATRLPDGQSSIDSTSMLRAENARRVELLVADAVSTSARNPAASRRILQALRRNDTRHPGSHARGSAALTDPCAL